MDRNDELESREPLATDHDDSTTGEEVGEAVGGVSGVVAGAAIGAAGGPIGAIIGGIAGAVGGWWAGKAVADATHTFTANDDDYYRESYERRADRRADVRYEDVRPAYQVGHLARFNPDYSGRSFTDIEGDLRSGWDNDQWTRVRPYAEEAYTRSASVTAREQANRVDDTRENLADELPNKG
jgi:hypothetical protein